MARNRETKIELTAYDDLFQTDESRAEAALSKIRDIPLSEIDEFPDHPFKVLMDEDMEQLVESIKRNGVMTPATVRLKENGRYELISGHRRKKACELAGLETLKCEVKDLTRDEAICHTKVCWKRKCPPCLKSARSFTPNPVPQRTRTQNHRSRQSCPIFPNALVFCERRLNFARVSPPVATPLKKNSQRYGQMNKNSKERS